MKKKTYILAILYLFFGIATNVIHPITTDYVRSLELNDVYFGIFFSLMSLGMLVGSLIFGKLSDKIGRTYLLSFGILGYGFFQFCFGYFNTIPWLILLFRIGSGIMVSAPHTLFLSFVRDLEDKENQGKSFSLMSSLYLLGTALGYKLGGFLYSEVHLDFINVFLVQVILCVLLSIIFVLLFYKENNNKIEISKKYGSLLNIKNMNLYLIIFLFSLFFITLGQTIVTKYIDVFVIDLNYNSNNLGDTILFSGIIGIVSNLVFIKLINKKKNVNYELIYIILTFVSVVSLLITFTVNQDNFIVMMYSSYVFYIISKSLMLPLEQTIISNNSKGNSGEVMGIRQSFIALGQVSGPLIASTMYGNNHYSVFYLSIVIYFVIGCILFVNYKKKKEAYEVN